MPTIQRITPCLWFDVQAEEAVRFYAALLRMKKLDIVSLKRAFAGEVIT